MTGWHRGAVSVALVWCSASATGQQVPVVVTHSAKDSVGQRMAFELREAVFASKQFVIPPSVSAPRIEVSLVTVPMDSKDEELGTIYSAAYVWTMPSRGRQEFMSHSVGHCGKLVVDECVRTVLARAVDAFERAKAIR
jgi:hypothetical protein